VKRRSGNGRTAQGERSAPLAADDAKSIAADKAAALALTPVSRETEARLDRYLDLLREWQAKTNLVAPSTLPQLWTRHIADSLQLLSLAPSAKIWVDLGSGGGFPGVVLACALAEVAGARAFIWSSAMPRRPRYDHPSRDTGPRPQERHRIRTAMQAADR